MHDAKATGRWAGFVYLIVVVTGIFSLAYVPAQLNVAGDPTATLANIQANAGLFRAGIAAFVIEQVAYLLLPLVLWRLFHEHNRSAAALMIAFVAMGVAVALVGVAHRLTAIELLTNTALLPADSQTQAAGLALLSLRNYSHAIAIASVFWGLWLLPFGYLVWTSRSLPRVLAVLLILGGIGYVADFLLDQAWPGYAATTLAAHITQPAALGEIGSCLWLLVMGARPPQRRALPQPVSA